MKDFYLQQKDYHLFIRQIDKFPKNGNKPTLVFLHDSWGCVEMWGDFLEVLTDMTGLNALLYDRLGYGQSSPFAVTQRTEFYLHEEAHQLVRILDSLNVNDVIIYGHSDGSTIALLTASFYPARVKGLILEGAHSFIEDSGKAAVLETRERAKTTSLLESLTKFHGAKTSELFRLWHETWLSDYFAEWTIVPLLRNIVCPVLAFQGEYDEFGSVEQLNVLKREISGSVHVSEIPCAWHTPRKQAEEPTLHLIKEWLDTTNCNKIEIL